MTHSVSSYPSYSKCLLTWRKYINPRFLRLTELQRWADGSQYEGRPSWWDDTVPRWERAPCVVYPVVAIATASNVDLALGGQRYPDMTAGPEDEGDVEGGLSTEQTQVFDRFLRNYHAMCRFPAHVREVYQQGQSVGTSVAVHGVRDGRPFAETIPAQWCEAQLDPAGKVLRLTVFYPYFDEVRKEDGTWDCVVRLYRREVDAVSDVTYLPADAREDGKPVPMTPDPSRSYQHGLGLCPVVWYRFMAGSTCVNHVDGHAIHGKLTDEIQAHDVALSSKHTACLLSEPQICEIGVEVGYNPTEESRDVVVPATQSGGMVSADNPQTSGYRTGRSAGKARKRGPGYVWQYPDKDTTVEVLEFPADSLKAQADHCGDLMRKVQDALSVVLLDPENLKIAHGVSGKALEALKQRQIDRVDLHRDDVRDCYVIPAIEMQLRIAAVTRPKVAGLQKALPLISNADNLPTVRVVYGPYSAPDPAEQLSIVQLVQAALGGSKTYPTQLITLDVAVRRIADMFGIEDVASIVKELEKAREEADAAAKEAAEAAAEAEPDGDEDGEKPLIEKDA